ncbi:hypothetical protein EYF80_055400 [Liparis tanakae]|uniref:Uncharacterized protein n=1 Tax=Liparis tanakae TaxID=230148 RepID=A0A4Z2F089_9TELE|nr:hypothetical protein EYF80_055400 [Liparis tanakae]
MNKAAGREDGSIRRTSVRQKAELFHSRSDFNPNYDLDAQVATLPHVPSEALAAASLTLVRVPRVPESSTTEWRVGDWRTSLWSPTWTGEPQMLS